MTAVFYPGHGVLRFPNPARGAGKPALCAVRAASKSNRLGTQPIDEHLVLRLPMMWPGRRTNGRRFRRLRSKFQRQSFWWGPYRTGAIRIVTSTKHSEIKLGGGTIGGKGGTQAKHYGDKEGDAGTHRIGGGEMGK